MIKTTAILRVTVTQKPFDVWLGMLSIKHFISEDQLKVLELAGDEGREYVSVDVDLDGELVFEFDQLIDVLRLSVKIKYLDVTDFITEGSRIEMIEELARAKGYRL